MGAVALGATSTGATSVFLLLALAVAILLTVIVLTRLQTVWEWYYRNNPIAAHMANRGDDPGKTPRLFQLSWFFVLGFLIVAEVIVATNP